MIVCLFCNIIVLGIGFNMLFYWENLLLMIKMLWNINVCNLKFCFFIYLFSFYLGCKLCCEKELFEIVVLCLLEN